MSPHDWDVRELGRAEAERRRRARLRAFPRFGPWLERTSPAMTWDWRWQRYVQAHYDAVTDGTIRKLMVMAPPRHGKSEMGTIRYPVYRMEREPGTRVVIGCHTATLAEKFSRKSRKLAKGRVGISTERKAVNDWETTAGGGMRAVGVGGSVTGLGANLIFLDDPVKSRKMAASKTFQEESYGWYCDDIFTRLDPRVGAIVLQMTRWHERDLAGQILASEDGPNWKVIRLPAVAEKGDELGRAEGEALCPEYWPLEKLAERKLVLRNSWHALYQQRPQALEGNFFQRDWFRVVPVGPPEDQIVSRIRYWDQAATEGDGDYTVGVRMSKCKAGLFWVEHVTRGQWAPHRRDQEIRRTAEEDPKGTRQHSEQEPGSSGKTVAQAFVRLLAGFPASAEVSTGNKEFRADPYASQLAVGAVKLIKGPWNEPFIREHTEFPTGPHDDQVDGASGAFAKLTGKRQGKAA